MALMMLNDANEQGRIQSKETVLPALEFAIRAFSVKYLIAEKTGCATVQEETCYKSIWSQAFKAAEYAKKKKTYQSALALYVIGLASRSVYSQKPVDFERSCFRAASDHVSKLRPYANISDPENHRILGHKVAYLCAALSDNAFQFNQPSSTRERTLLWEGDQIWTTVRYRTDMFHQSFAKVHGMHEPMSKEVLSTILQHATMFKSMIWWDFNSMCHDRVDLLVRDVVTFNKVFVPLLDLISRDFLMIHPKEQLNYGK